MRTYNSVAILGNVTRDPECRSKDGNNMAAITVATDTKWRDKNSGEWKERGEFTRCIAFGSLAGIIEEYISKGSPVFLTGALRTRKFQKDGHDHWATEVIIDQFSMLGTPEENRERRKGSSTSETSTSDFIDDDIPF